MKRMDGIPRCWQVFRHSLIGSFALLSWSCRPPGTYGTARPDPTDYDARRAPIQALYQRDVVGYWATMGLPPLARLARLVEDHRGDPRMPFEGLMPAFDANAFMTGVETRTLPTSFVRLAIQQLQNGRPAWDASVAAIRAMVEASDRAFGAGGATDPLVVSTAADLAIVFQRLFAPSVVAALAPAGSKQFSEGPPPNPPSDICRAGSDAINTITTVDAGTDDHSTTTRTKWDAITTPSIWNVTYSAACIAVAVGACAHNLSPALVLEGDTTCEGYNELSKQLGAKPRVLGGYADDRDKWFKDRGYCGSRAWNGPFESACREAKNAKSRGCDVFIDYENADGHVTHTEMVTSVSETFVGNLSDKCRLGTLSWGQTEGVTYDHGRFSDKSDASRYGQGSYLGESHGARLIYYCKC